MINGVSFTQGVTYDATTGQVKTRHYPNSGTSAGVENTFGVEYHYTNGYLARITSTDTSGSEAQGNCIEHWRAERVDALGRVVTDTLGRIIRSSRDFNAEQGVLEGISAQSLVGQRPALQNISYGYDSLNNVEFRANQLRNTRDDFSYDSLDRLLSYNSADSSGTRSTTVSYDGLGNIRSKSDVGNYQYLDPSKPHRLTKVSSPVGSTDPLARFHVNVEFGDQVVLNTPPTRLDEPFVYDANGNILTSGNRTMAWTSFNKPYRMSKTHGVATVTRAQYHYGPDFNRTVKVKDTGENTPALETTLYIGKEYEHITDRTGAVKHRYTLSAGSSTIQIERDDNSNKDTPQYLLSDALGSTDVIVNASGEVEQQMAFDPWGQRLNVGGTQSVNAITNKGYTGHEMDDEVGLTNMNARIYDPVLGRFLSADPVLPDASDLQAFNRYAYVQNNPIAFIDPTGNSRLNANPFCSCSSFGVFGGGPAQEIGPKSASEPGDNIDGTGPDWNAAGKQLPKEWGNLKAGDVTSTRTVDADGNITITNTIWAAPGTLSSPTGESTSSFQLAGPTTLIVPTAQMVSVADSDILEDGFDSVNLSVPSESNILVPPTQEPIDFGDFIPTYVTADAGSLNNPRDIGPSLNGGNPLVPHEGINNLAAGAMAVPLLVGGAAVVGAEVTGAAVGRTIYYIHRNGDKINAGYQIVRSLVESYLNLQGGPPAGMPPNVSSGNRQDPTHISGRRR